MITWMQKHRKYLVITIWISTIAFVGAGFVGWGAYSYNSNSSGVAAVVGNQKITMQELDQAYTNIYNYYQEKSKGTFTEEKAKKLNLKHRALLELENNALLLNYANKLGLTALDSEVEQNLESTKAFQNGGVFNKDQYYRVLRNFQITPKEYENSIRRQIILSKINNILNLSPTPLEIDTFGASLFMQDKLLVKTITLDKSKISINDKDLKNFWSNRKKDYLTKKSYLLDIIKIPVSFIEVDANETKQFYQENRYKYTDNNGKIENFEQAKNQVIRDLQFKKAKIFALRKYIAFKHNKIKTTETKLVTVDNENFPQKKLNIASVGDVLKPFKEKESYIIAKIEKVNMPKPMTFQEAKQKVKKDYYIVAEKNILIKKAKNSLKNFTTGTDLGFVSRDDTKKIKGLTNIEALEFLNQLFSSNKKEGYQIFENKAIIYKILEQKLLDKDKLKVYNKLLKDVISNTKTTEINEQLLMQLIKTYKIKSYYKGQ